MSTNARHQALLSEYKGNLFEFLVGSALSRKLSLEVVFLKGLSLEFKKMLQIQESFIREFYSHLLVDLPILADKLSDEIIESLEISNKNISDIVIVGKVALASQNDQFAEADIILKSKEVFFPISVKLSKANAFVNTKSAGLKSFMSKYFRMCEPDRIDSYQDEFNNKVDIILNEFGREICSFNDLSFDGSFSEWIIAGKTCLSGELNKDERVIYKKMLYRLNKEIYDVLRFLYEKEPIGFSKEALSLIGFGDESVIQATSYYKAGIGKYNYFKSHVEKYTELKGDSSICQFGDLKKSAANFDLFFDNRILQIRVKAMNKFTHKSFKLNCSVKIN